MVGARGQQQLGGLQHDCFINALMEARLTDVQGVLSAGNRWNSASERLQGGYKGRMTSKIRLWFVGTVSKWIQVQTYTHFTLVLVPLAGVELHQKVHMRWGHPLPWHGPAWPWHQSPCHVLPQTLGPAPMHSETDLKGREYYFNQIGALCIAAESSLEDNALF